MIKRDISDLLRIYASEFRAILIVGPRQSGKTTLVKQVFKDKQYVSLENPDERYIAENDPRAFLKRFPKGAIFDEIQRAPSLLNYLQEILDTTEEDGLFILTGSNNVLLQESVTQSLAGRIGVLDLYPLGFNELPIEVQQLNLNQILFRGAYPEVLVKRRNPTLWYNSYIRTYIERDVKQLKNIENTLLFIKFVKLCAGRIGLQLNSTSLSNECGIDVKTVNAWLSVLEATYIIKLITPYYKNFNKRLVKTPKLYFIDTGLACSLLGIRKEEELENSHFRGALVENFILLEVLKKSVNSGTSDALYYWRDNKGLEIDLIVESESGQMLPIEIKSSQTYTNKFSQNISKFCELAALKIGYVLYDGLVEFVSSENIHVQSWRTFLNSSSRERDF
jgi:predicted AAA+ superfamily ATPase